MIVVRAKLQRCVAFTLCGCSGFEVFLCAEQRKLKNVIEKTGMKGQLAIIACLVITLVILLVLVVS